MHNFILLAILLFSASILILPICSIFVFCKSCLNFKNFIMSLACAFICSALLAYFGFFIWFYSQLFGKIYSVLIFFSSLAMMFFAFYKSKYNGYIWEFLLISGIWIFYAIFIFSAGLAPFGITDNILFDVANRFSHPLPIDNQLPYILAHQISTNNLQIPMVGDWLSSDRPPLQSAYFLCSLGFLFRDSILVYQVFSSMLQSSWIVVIYYVFREFRIPVIKILIILLVLLFSGFTVVHTLYVWPKLLPVSFILLIVGVIFSVDKKNLGVTHGIVVGLLSAFSMLSHGGSFFPLSGIAFAYFITRGLPSFSFIFSVFVSFFMLMMPWSIYQGKIDPPGNRLLKWHLAGVIPVDNRTFIQALAESYRLFSINTIFQYKLSNFATLFGNFEVWSVQLIHLIFCFSSSLEKLSFREAQFFSVAASLGVFCFTPICFFMKVKKIESEFFLSKIFFIISFFTSLVWCLALFGPSSAVIHQGSLALLFFLYAGCILKLLVYSKILSFFLITFHFLSV